MRTNAGMKCAAGATLIGALVTTTGSANAALTNLVLNGGFENNTAPHPVFNRIINSEFNAYMPNCVAYGTNGDYVIESNPGPYGGNSGDGNWHIALNQTGAISMALSQSLVAGQYYEVSFKYSLLNVYYVNPGELKVGVSTSATSFGTMLTQMSPLSFPALANKQGWETRTFGFVASQGMNGANRLTFSGSMSSSDPFTWIGIDAVSMVPAPGAAALLGVAGLLSRRRRA